MHAMVLVGALSAALGGTEPIGLHPKNPHYFQFRGRPQVLITSGEHYGAVLNLDFDYLPYLDELAARGFNLTRTFSGTYREIPGSFEIRGNTLGPAPGKFISPWARSSSGGYFDGGNKFDLDSFDPEYFRRLKDFIGQAGKRGIVVELVLFCPLYNEDLWKANPMNDANNINGLGAIPSAEVYTLKHQRLLALQVKAARKLVEETAGFDNLYYEVSNEPYFGGVTIEWQDRIIEAIVAAESSLAGKHLIARNVANGSARIEMPNPALSIFNFHYASPPSCVTENYHLGKVIAFDETGFRGPDDRPYRREAWDFILSGGAVYDNLDYSYTPEKEDGSAVPKAPGGGGPALREQLQVLKKFIERFDFVAMAPDAALLQGAALNGLEARALSERGKAYAVYIRTPEKGPAADPAAERHVELKLDLPAGSYIAEWLNLLTGRFNDFEPFKHPGGPRPFSSPAFRDEIALSVKRTGE
jgi:hypothetical protein